MKYGAVVETTWLRDLLSWVIPALVFFSVWMFATRRFAERMGGGGGFLSIGKGEVRVYVKTITGVTFDDVAGVNEAKEESKEAVNGALGCHGVDLVLAVLLLLVGLVRRRWSGREIGG